MTFIDSILDKTERIIAQNNKWIAFLDESPINIGHVILLPTKKKSSFFELDQDDLHAFHQLLSESKTYIDSKYSPQGFNIVINEGVVSGKVVDWLVVHFIPRYLGDTEKQIASGARVILNKYVAPEFPDEKYSLSKKYDTEYLINNLSYNGSDPDKTFFIGTKVLIINDDKKILGLSRNDAKFIGGIDLPGGRIEHRDYGEIYTAQREVKEEIGVYLDQLEEFGHFILWDVNFNKPDSKPLGLLLVLYISKISSQTKINLRASEKFNEYNWYEPEQLAELLTQYPAHIRAKIRCI